jgi:hypothetical protein
MTEPLTPEMMMDVCEKLKADMRKPAEAPRLHLIVSEVDWIERFRSLPLEEQARLLWNAWRANPSSLRL